MPLIGRSPALLARACGPNTFCYHHVMETGVLKMLLKSTNYSRLILVLRQVWDEEDDLLRYLLICIT